MNRRNNIVNFNRVLRGCAMVDSKAFRNAGPQQKDLAVKRFAAYKTAHQRMWSKNHNQTLYCIFGSKVGVPADPQQLPQDPLLRRKPQQQQKM